VIIEHDGKFLATRGIGDTVWEFPGGRLNADEDPQDSLIREVKEEVNLLISNPRPVHAVKSLHRKSGVWRILLISHARVDSVENFKIDPSEVEEYRWLTREELATLPLFGDCRAGVDAFLSQTS
jgi:8-oxo-dGTP pyrophosphatase MutT (NUDIX family)